MPRPISDFLDQRARPLYENISKTFHISIIEHNGSSFRCRTRGNKSEIYVPSQSHCKDSFAHELLHIYLKSKNILVADYIFERVQDDTLLSSIFSKDLFDHIGNCLEHIKMLPIYLSLGFKLEKFLFDYSEPKCSIEEITSIKLSLPSKIVWKYGADLYIGKYIGVRACPNKSIQYSGYLFDLQTIDPELYKLLDDFINSWITFELKYSAEDKYHYENICNLFLSNLREWCESKSKNIKVN